jgi:predicted enzyme related to lactoylglutathione lyase
MPSNLRHLAINADDIAASAHFYECVFGWRFQPYRQPGFMRTRVGDLLVALQQRRLIGDVAVTGFEATVAVPDITAAATAARSEGGRVLTEPTTIAGVGDLVFLGDPGGNIVGAMQYSRSTTTP